jgi:hypothetical protein
MKLRKALVGFVCVPAFCNYALALSKTVAWRLGIASATRILPLLLFLTLPAAVQAQFTYRTNHGTITITGYTGSGGAVVIPSSTNGYPVTSIGDSAFGGYNNLTSITIPDSVTSIGYTAFWYCTSLASVTIGTNVTWIGMSAFYGCTSLTNITIPDSVTYIGFSAFEACTSLTTVTIGTGVTDISGEAFSSCSSLTGVYFRGDAPSLAHHTFHDDDNATVYYLTGTTGWGRSFGGRPAVLWDLPVKTTAASFGVRTNRFGFSITWASGTTVVVEACTNLVNPIWYPLATNTLSGGSSYFSDPRWTNYTRRFYRLRSP